MPLRMSFSTGNPSVEGRVIWQGASAPLSVAVRPLHYSYEGTEKYWPGGTLDLTSSLPATVGTWAWILVVLNPSTNTLAAVTGPEYGSQAALLDNLIPELDAGASIPLAAIQASQADTSLSSIRRYRDVRHRLDLPGGAGGIHNHDDLYSLIIHDHAGIYSLIDHDHVGIYSLTTHHHDSLYSPLGHSHASYVHPNHTGDVTSVGDGATTIANNVVTLAKIQQIQTQRLLGRNTAAAGDVEELSALPTDIDALYFLLAGRPANYQIAYGGNASGGNLLLRSTSHSTKGFVIVADDGGNIGLGTASPDTKVHMVDSGLPTRTERITTFSNSLLASFSLKLTSSNNIVDGFGPVFLFEINDNTLSGLNVIGRVGAIRDGADNSGAVVIHTTDAGTESEKVRVKPDGRLEAKAGRSVGLQTAIGGVMFVSTTAVGNVGTGEDNLITYNVPANTLANDGDSIWFEASGTIANTTNTPRLRVRFGTAGTNLIGDALWTASSPDQWTIRGRIIRTGATAQKGYMAISYHPDSSGDWSGESKVQTSLNQTLSTATELRITGEAVVSNEIICHSLIVGYDPANT